MKPLGPVLLCGALVLLAVTADNPLLLGAVAAAAAILLAAARGPRRAYIVFAAVSAVLVMLVNPFASVQGLTPLFELPAPSLLDGEVTAEELVFGAGAGLRILGSALAIGAFVRLADGDLVLRGVSRVAPRSAMIAALAARLLPTMERDAAGITLAARARGVERRRRRDAAGLLGPLVSLSLERSLLLAEAMEARGYGGGPRTRATPRPPTARERVMVAAGAAALATAVVTLLTGAATYEYYDLLNDPLQPGALAAAAAVLAASGVAALAVRWPR